MRRSLWLVRLASLLTPPTVRREWRREWEAELHCASETMAGRGDEQHAISAQLVRFARGAFHDAFWQGRGNWTQEGQPAGACLAALTGVIAVIVLASGFLPRTRAVFMPLPYRDAGRIATVSQAGTIATRSGIRGSWVSRWRSQSRLAEDVATYSWNDARGEEPRAATVSGNFFTLLGAKTTSGRQLERADLSGCQNCAVLSYDFWREGNRPGTIVAGGNSYRVAAVLDQGFWFLSPKIGVWTIDSEPAADSRKRTGVVVRLRPDVKPKELARELERIVSGNGENAWDSLVDVAPIASSVRGVLGSFGFGVGIATIVVAASLRLRLPRWNVRAPIRRSIFFACKTTLLLLAVLFAGIEFTRAASLTMLAGTDAGAEPLCTWLFLMGSMGVLCWSISDQRRRCRVCLRRLGMAAHVGCPGCLLLDWAGTELVCIEGHGMLHVADLAACWSEPERWTSLDDSWQGLFQRSS